MVILIDLLARCYTDVNFIGTIAWTATSFCFQMAINHKDKAGSVLDGAELLTHLLARYALIEVRYMAMPSDALNELETCVIGVYEATLEYLAEMKSFQNQTKLGIILKSITPLSDSALKRLKDTLQSRDEEVERWTKLIEDECRTTQFMELKALVKTVVSPIYNIDHQTASIDEYVRRQNRHNVLAWISTTNYSVLHKSARDKAVGSERRAPGKWVLDEPEYRYWQGAIIPSVLWLSGDLGTGKTTLISTIIELVKTLYNEENRGTIAYFYCSGTLGTSIDSILRSIIRQLANSRQGLDMVTKKWEAKSYGEELLALDESKEMIKKLVNLNGRSQTTIIIDALDEISHDDLAIFFEVLDGLMQMKTPTCLLKVILSSRPETRIGNALGHWPKIEVAPIKTKSDITFYIGTEVETRLRDRDQYVKDNIKTTLAERARGMFTYIEFAINYVCSSLDGNMETALDELPIGLEAMYSSIFANIKNDRYVELARRTILWLYQAKESLPSQCLITAICVELNMNPDTITPEDILQVCRHLVVFNRENDHFDFRHFSVLEFIRKV
ncbi:hypothetical protein F4815DRAFT_431358 [Daldinia loculata]|nr:hypothetical protein F4815DRAFT_431358 [Daldinia loculata]